MTMDEARRELKTLQKSLRAYTHATGLLSYDGVTGAPKGGAPERAETLAFLSGELYKLKTDEKTVAMLDLLQEHAGELTAAEARQTQILRKDLRQLRAVPLEEYVAYQQLCSESDDVWHTAKQTDDWPLWEPYL